MRNVTSLVCVLVLVGPFAGAACAPIDEASTSSAPAAGSCGRESLPTLTRGALTFGTDQPAYSPWFIDDDPANGKGFESAVSYAVADELGFGRQDVKWVRAPFNAAIAPGPKTFDANISEFSITDDRRQAVDFSSPYFDVTQAVVAVTPSPAAAAKSRAALVPLRLGAQVGTTSYLAATAINSNVAVYNNNDDAKAALTSGQIDALVLDLPTAFTVQGQLTNGVIVGQLPPAAKPEQFGLVLDKGSPLTACVSEAVDELGANGDLFRMQKEWLAGAGKAPMLP